jgi:hypothetical protein
MVIAYADALQSAGMNYQNSMHAICVESDKETKQRKRFHRSTLSVHSVQFLFIGAPKARCCQSHGCEPLFPRTRIPHASPPVIEPAQGTPRAIRVNHPSNLYACLTTSPIHQEIRLPKHVQSHQRIPCSRPANSRKIEIVNSRLAVVWELATRLCCAGHSTKRPKREVPD